MRADFQTLPHGLAPKRLSGPEFTLTNIRIQTISHHTFWISSLFVSFTPRLQPGVEVNSEILNRFTVSFRLFTQRRKPLKRLVKTFH